MCGVADSLTALSDVRATMRAMQPLELFDRSAAVATGIVNGVKEDQFNLPTPCPEWTVRGVVNHMVVGNMMAEAIAAGQRHPDRSVDWLGDDPRAAFAESVRVTREVLADPELPDRTVTTPFGEQPGLFLIRMRVSELYTHAWDVAKATGQPTDLDPELAELLLPEYQARLASRPRAMASMFGEAAPVPDGAAPADRLAAYLGRSVAGQ